MTSIKGFGEIPHDSKTIGTLLNQLINNGLQPPKKVVCDRGGKEQKQIGNTSISTPDNRPLKRDSDYQRRKKETSLEGVPPLNL